MLSSSTYSSVISSTKGLNFFWWQSLNRRSISSLMEKVTLKAMVYISIYNTTTKGFREENLNIHYGKKLPWNKWDISQDIIQLKTIWRRNCWMDTISSQCQDIICINQCCHCFKPIIKYSGSVSKNVNGHFCYLSTQWYDKTISEMVGWRV